MIIKVKKVLIYGIKKQLDIFLKTAQEKAFLQFIKKYHKKSFKLSKLVNDYITAIKILKKEPKITQEETDIEPLDLVNKILNLNQGFENLSEESRIIDSEIMRIKPFGNFSNENLKDLEDQINRKFQFFTIKKSKSKKLKISEDLIFISSFYDLDYYLAINKEKKTYPKMIEILIDKPLNELLNRKAQISKEIHSILNELKSLAKYLNFLHKYLLKELNNFHFQEARNLSSHQIENKLFAIEAWVPTNKEEKLKKLIKDFDISYSEIAIEKDDKIPTYLENKDYSKVGEDVMKIYDIPSVSDKDPSLFILIFFSLFFAVIVSDAGYGLVYLILALILKIKFKNSKPIFKRFTKLMMILSIATVLWGSLTGSFFGLGLNPKSSYTNLSCLNYLATKKADYHVLKKDDVYQDWRKKYPNVTQLKDGKDFLEKISKKEENGQMLFEAFDAFKNNILLEFSLLIGVIHITISFLRNLKRNFSGIGWILFMIGGYLFFPSILNATSFIHFLNILDKPTCFFIGKIILFSGLLLSIVISLIQKRLKGVLEVTNAISVFADILSYLRLYALALAGMIMANTFNSLGASMGIFFGFLVILVGHVVNILLCVMGGVIHGLRLNFIEWYHYSFDGDGKLFDPLRLLK